MDAVAIASAAKVKVTAKNLCESHAKRLWTKLITHSGCLLEAG